jgi:thymidylate synthase (FAD)
VAVKAIRKCWASEDRSDTTNTNNTLGPKDRELVHRVGCKNKHASTLEHINYTFDIDGISRACLQELARHRHASLSVKSTRYTLKELKEIHEDDTYKLSEYLVSTGNKDIDETNALQLSAVVDELKVNTSNDIVKYMLPEAYKTSLVWTINLRSLKNFLKLRTSPAALPEIRELAWAIVDQLPKEHLYLVEEDLI